VTQRRTRIFNAVFLALGLALLVVVLVRMDASEVWDHVVDAGWFLVPAFGAYLGSLLASTLAWGRLFPPGHRARFRTLFSAFWAGHGMNMVAPGGATGVVLKGTLLAREVDGEEVTASLVTYSYFDAVSMISFTVLGPLLCLFWFDVPTRVVAVLAATSGFFAVAALGLRVLLRRGLVAQAVRTFGRVPWLRPRNLERLQARAMRVDERVRAFRQAQPADFRATVLYMVAVRMFQVLEAWFLLLPLIPDETAGELLLLALLTQAASQLINWVGAFIPGRVGVAEGGIALLFELLGIGSVVGLAFALLRRGRKILGAAVGLTIGAVMQARPPRRVPEALEDAAHPLPLGPTDSEA
jgi:uncharacterized protein (TIRG00374 family)